MPIYEYYCAENHTIYQFYAKTFAQGQQVPPCPDNPALKLQKTVSSFAINRGAKEPGASSENGDADASPAEDAKMEAAMSAMENEFSHVDENDPRAMARMMRRMSEITGEKIDGEMEEVVRKLEEGADPDSLEEKFGGTGEDGESSDPYGDGQSGAPGEIKPKEKRHRFKVRHSLPRRDPVLYDYPDRV